MEKHKVLITGAGGYIGSTAASLFLNNQYEVIALDNFSTGFKEPLKQLQNEFGESALRIYEQDLRRDLSSLFEKEKNIKTVVHYAAVCRVDESMKEPDKYFDNNVCASHNLLKTMVNYQVSNLVFSSTCAVYGEAQYVPVDEKHPLKPTNPYGASKYMTEAIIKWYGRLKNINYVILRYFNVCGANEDGSIGDSKKPSTLLVQNAVRGALEIEPFYLTCPEVDTEDSTPVRDYINVLDLNRAHLKAIEYLDRGGKSEVINLGTGAGNSVLEIIQKVQETTGKKFKLKKTTPRKGEYAKMIADIKKAKNILGWQPKKTIGGSIKSLVKWYKKHPQGWEK